MISIQSLNKTYLKIGINTFIQMLGKIISVLLSVFTVSLLTRYLGVDGYGKYLLIFTFLSFFGIFADFGLHLTIIKEISREKRDISVLYGTYFWLKIFFSLLSIIIPILILIFTPYDAETKTGIIIGAFAISIGSFSGYNNALYQTSLRLDLITLLDIISRVVTTIFLIIFIYLKFQLIFLISAVLIGNLSSLFATLIIARNRKQIYLSFNFEIAKKILKRSIPIGIMSLLSLLYFKIDTIMISFLRSPDELGYYGFSYKIFENILMLWGFYMASLYPLFATNIQNNSEKFYTFFRKSILVAIISSVIILVVFLLFSNIIIGVLGGPSFQQSYLAILILLFSCPLFFINNIFFHIFLIKNNSQKLILLIIFSLFINIAMNFVFISRIGYIGASITTGITELFLLVSYMLFLNSLKIIKDKNIYKL